MSKYIIEAVALVSAIIARHNKKLGPSQIASRVVDIDSIGRTLHKLYEDDCNLDTSPRREKREKKLEEKVTSIAKELGVTVEFQGDPRGWPLIIRLPNDGRDDGSAPRLGGRG
jgi:hypothetical protein